MQKNQNKIHWIRLSKNSNAYPILINNIDKINWLNLSCNLGTIEINYSYLRKKMDIIREDLIKTVFHPKKLEYYLTKHNYDIFEEDIE